MLSTIAGSYPYHTVVGNTALCVTANLSRLCPRMGWSGRAPTLTATKLARGTEDKGACHVPDTQQQNRRDRHRYRQEFVPRCRPRSAWSSAAAPEVVAWPGGGAACQPAAVPHRYGGLHRGASSQSQASGAWPRRPADAGEIRARLF